jgi:hypothetical protein
MAYLMACLVLLGVAWCCLVVVLGCGWITGLMTDRWWRAGGCWLPLWRLFFLLVVDGLLGVVWLAVGLLGVAWLAVGLLGVAWWCLVVSGSPG